KQSYTMHCWGFADTVAQYAGWPVTTKVLDNVYASSPYATPKIKVKGVTTLPLITVVDVNGNVLYSIKTNNQRLKVPKEGTYKLLVKTDKMSKEVLVDTGKGSVKVKFE
ncbi:MAG: hypothetical protein ACKOXB_00960, partial [Flavobacteriales bacterium]